ncbi:MAG TPA: ribbon-helix-helix protein, CopG family [Chloroflexota bacterium]|nr:ribbon-helix-helix protein, CopG family [Chloroflexota bacterium]
MHSSAGSTIVLSSRVPLDTKTALDQLAKATGRTRNTLVQEALRRFIEQQRWQIGEIEAGIREADAGVFVSDAEMEETWAEFGLEPDAAGECVAE